MGDGVEPSQPSVHRQACSPVRCPKACSEKACCSEDFNSQVSCRKSFGRQGFREENCVSKAGFLPGCQKDNDNIGIGEYRKQAARGPSCPQSHQVIGIWVRCRTYGQGCSSAGRRQRHHISGSQLNQNVQPHQRLH